MAADAFQAIVTVIISTRKRRAAVPSAVRGGIAHMIFAANVRRRMGLTIVAQNAANH